MAPVGDLVQLSEGISAAFTTLAGRGSVYTTGLKKSRGYALAAFPSRKRIEPESIGMAKDEHAHSGEQAEHSGERTARPYPPAEQERQPGNEARTPSSVGTLE